MIWFDLDNSPHVPLFHPLLDELDIKQEEYLITARDFSQTRDLLELHQLKYNMIGRHGGKNKFNKVVNLFVRGYQLKKFISDKQIRLAVSHGSRTQLMASKLSGIKSLLMFDYEYTESKIFNILSTYMFAPVFIPDERLRNAGFKLNKIIRYNGYKEELYLSSFKPVENFRETLEIGKDKFMIVLRPPGMAGNYHNKRSELLLQKTIEHLLLDKNVVIIILPRTEIDRNYILKHISFSDQIRFLEKTVDGLQLLFVADLTISGGGTMNRESALLGTETYSIFTGRKPFLDEHLEKIGRLRFIRDVEDIKNIKTLKKEKKSILLHNPDLVTEVTGQILNLAENWN